MMGGQVAWNLPRSHSPVLRWIRNPLSLGRGGSNPSLGAILQVGPKIADWLKRLAHFLVEVQACLHSSLWILLNCFPTIAPASYGSIS